RRPSRRTTVPRVQEHGTIASFPAPGSCTWRRFPHEGRMVENGRFLVLALLTGLVSPAVLRGDDKLPRPPMGCAAAVDNYFEHEVWAKVGLPKCLTCHRKGGDADSSQFVLIDPRKKQGAARDKAMRYNRAAFARMATLKEKNQPRMLLKVVG